MSEYEGKLYTQAELRQAIDSAKKEARKEVGEYLQKAKFQWNTNRGVKDIESLKRGELPKEG